jgi:hypothetical protein
MTWACWLQVATKQLTSLHLRSAAEIHKLAVAQGRAQALAQEKAEVWSVSIL